MRETRRRERQEAEARAKLVQAARTRREAIVERWRWDAVDVWESSPTRIDDPIVDDPRFFIGALFSRDAVVWTGEVFHSGRRHADRWRTAQEWQDADQREVGPMIAPAIWKPGTVNRTGENVLAAPYVVCDFDGFDDVKPADDEIEAHIAASLAIIRWLREGMGWQLAALIHTGNKSVHAWFRHPGAAALQSLRDTAPALGIDAGLIGHPEHPARLPGQRHAKSGISRTLWLKLPNPD
jgi:hypothetical protein